MGGHFSRSKPSTVATVGVWGNGTGPSPVYTDDLRVIELAQGQQGYLAHSTTFTGRQVDMQPFGRADKSAPAGSVPNGGIGRKRPLAWTS